jgi:ATP-dependent RNA helicase DeaD
LVAELFEAGARHVLVFCRSEDRAADVGDRLTLRGFTAGAPSETDVPVWLGVDALEARAALEGVDGVVVVSADVPTDEDTLDRRHGISPEGVVLALGREVEHLKDVARRTGYGLVPFPSLERRAASVLSELHETLEEALENEDIGAYLVALDPLFERHDPAEIAAAAVALLRRKTPAMGSARPRAEVASPSAAPSWSKLFVSVGSRDGLVPGDLVGAVTGEAGVPGETVGKIDIRESHTLLEVHDDVAQKVIKALNGITIRGRAVRVDFDRPRRGGPPAGRRGPPRRGPDA